MIAGRRFILSLPMICQARGGTMARLSISRRSPFPPSFKRFQCLQCGKCCTLSVEPAEGEIRRIEMLGYKRERFLKNGMLAKVGGACCFLERRGDSYCCGIHEIKPAVCRRYPFTVLKRDNLFSCPGLRA